MSDITNKWILLLSCLFQTLFDDTTDKHEKILSVIVKTLDPVDWILNSNDILSWIDNAQVHYSERKQVSGNYLVSYKSRMKYNRVNDTLDAYICNEMYCRYVNKCQSDKQIHANQLYILRLKYYIELTSRFKDSLIHHVAILLGDINSELTVISLLDIAILLHTDMYLPNFEYADIKELISRLWHRVQRLSMQDSELSEKLSFYLSNDTSNLTIPEMLAITSSVIRPQNFS